MKTTPQRIETGALPIGLINDLKRIDSHLCSIAYPILEQAGVPTPTRHKQGMRFEESRLHSITRPAALED